MEGAGELGIGIGAGYSVAGIVSMTRAAPATAIAARPLEPIGTGKRPRTSGQEASRAPSDWRSRIERTMRQQGQEQTQLHRTVGHLASLLEAQAAHEEAQWLGMTKWMQERE